MPDLIAAYLLQTPLSDPGLKTELERLGKTPIFNGPEDTLQLSVCEDAPQYYCWNCQQDFEWGWDGGGPIICPHCHEDSRETEHNFTRVPRPDGRDIL